jgi:hypothetical protein
VIRTHLWPRGSDPVAPASAFAAHIPSGPRRATSAARTSAREFRDPQDVSWSVDLIRAGGTGDVTRPGRPVSVSLRFQNGAESRHLSPIPPDWRECDCPTLWRYCQLATP